MDALCLLGVPPAGFLCFFHFPHLLNFPSYTHLPQGSVYRL